MNKSQHLRLIAELIDKNGSVLNHILDKPSTTTLGYLRSNSLWIPSPYAADTSKLVTLESNRLFIRVHPSWAGLLHRKNEQVSVNLMKDMGLVKAQSDATFLIPLEEGSKLELHLSPYTLKLSIQRIPSASRIISGKLSLLGSLRAVPRAYSLFLLFSFLGHFVVWKWVKSRPVREDAGLEQIARQFERIQVTAIPKISDNLQKQVDIAKKAEPTPTESEKPVRKKADAGKRDFQKSLQSAPTTGGTFSSLLSSGGANSFGAKNSRPKNEGSFSSIVGGLGLNSGANLGTSGKTLDIAPDARLNSQAGKTLLDANIKGPSMASISADSSSKGSLDSQVLYTFLSTRSGQLQGCYEQALEKNPLLSGKTLIEVMVSEEGRASKVQINSQDIADASFKECLIKRINAWQFPRPKGGSVNVRFPLIFTSSTRG